MGANCGERAEKRAAAILYRGCTNPPRETSPRAASLCAASSRGVAPRRGCPLREGKRLPGTMRTVARRRASSRRGADRRPTGASQAGKVGQAAPMANDGSERARPATWAGPRAVGSANQARATHLSYSALTLRSNACQLVTWARGSPRTLPRCCSLSAQIITKRPHFDYIRPDFLPRVIHSGIMSHERRC